MPGRHWFVRTSLSSAGLFLAASIASPSAFAQGITFTPYIGSYYAVASIVETKSATDEDVTLDQTNTAVFGARLSVPIGGIFSVEGAFAYAKSQIVLRVANSCTDGTFLFDCSTSDAGSVLIASGRVLIRPRRSNLHGILGASWVNHSGEAWETTTTPEKPSDFGAVVGFGLRASVTPRISLSLTAEAHIYSLDPDGDGTAFESKSQQDLLFTVGIPIGLSGN